MRMQKDTCAEGTWDTKEAFIGNHFSSVLIEQRAGTQHRDKSLQIMVAYAHSDRCFCLPDSVLHYSVYLQGAKIFWRSFCLFPTVLRRHAACECLSSGLWWYTNMYMLSVINCITKNRYCGWVGFVSEHCTYTHLCVFVLQQAISVILILCTM